METAQLTVIEGPEDALNQVFLLSRTQERTLGRSSVCHFQIEDPLISSLHCYFSYEDGRFIVNDLLAANGVMVNKNLIDATFLNEGDIIKVGKTVLEVSDYKGSQKGKKYITGDRPDISRPISPIPSHEPSAGVKTTLGRMIKKQRDLSICRLALKNHLLQHQQIRELLDIQKKSSKEGKTIDLADLLVSRHLLSDSDIEKLLREHNYYKVRNKDIHLGKVVIEQQLVKEDNVQECLEIQERYFHETGQLLRLGEILVQKGYLTIKQNNRIIKHLLKQKQE